MFQVSRLPQLIEAQIQPSSKVAVGFTQEVWNVLAVMSDEGKLLEQNEKENVRIVITNSNNIAVFIH